MAQRLDKIGELLAKGVFLYLKKEQEKAAKEENKSAKFKPKIDLTNRL